MERWSHGGQQRLLWQSAAHCGVTHLVHTPVLTV